MAGSYNHVITKSGNLREPDSFAQMIENLGDAYEMAEEMYGMIWFLASMGPEAAPMSAEDLVEHARQNYALGLKLAKQNPNKRKRT